MSTAAAIDDETTLARKERRLAARKKWADANPEKMKQCRKDWSANNPERVRLIANRSTKAYNARNSEMIRAKRALAYAANPGPTKLRSHLWLSANAEKAKNRSRVYSSFHKGEQAKRSAKWYSLNREKAKTRARQYKAANPNAVRKSVNKRRAIKRNVEVGDVAVISRWEESWRKRATVTCHWCRRTATPKNCHTDHIVALSLGGRHSIENLCISCEPCNLRKGAKSQEAWNNLLLEPVLL